MLIKTNELTGAALDWAVAQCEGATGFWFDSVATYWVKLHGQDRALRYGWAQSYLPSTDWAQAGPIIERELIALSPYLYSDDAWQATLATPDKHYCAYVLTPLIAAMRCYVASKWNHEIEIPKELV